MVSNCNRTLVFLLISGYRYIQGFGSISARVRHGSPRRGAGVSQGKLPRAIHSASTPCYFVCDSYPILVLFQHNTPPSPPNPPPHPDHTPLTLIQSPTQPSTVTIYTPPPDTRYPPDTRHKRQWTPPHKHAGTCFLDSSRQHVLTEMNHTDTNT